MDFTFAELLRSYRERASLDQGELAAALGIHRNTLSRWERGQYLPRDRELVLRLAEDLSLTPAETEQFLRAAYFWVAHSSADRHTAHHQLRPPVADFVGRELEAAQLVRALQDGVTRGNGAVISGVQGMGGIGKTELAYQVAHRLRDVFPDAQILLDLRGSSATPLIPEQALQTVIRAFAHEEKLPDDLCALQRRYRSALHGQSVLIVADDARDAAQLRPLIPPANCALLVTSRRRFTLPGMATVHLEQLGAQETVTLLRTICASLSEDQALALADACGYLPLALRISGGILRNDPALTVGAYLARLTDQRQRLAHLRDPDDSQLDMEASLALSYAGLDAATQGIFRQLGVLSADFATPLALAVVEAPADVDVEATLHRLLRHNLLMYDAARARWRMHDLVRDLARGYLAAEEAEAAWWRYACAMVQLAQATHMQYMAGGDGVMASLAQFDAERPHIDAARSWLVTQAGIPAADTLLVAEALATTQTGRMRYSMWHERIPQSECALAAAQRLGDQEGEGLLLIRLGRAYLEVGAALRSFPYFERGLAIAQAIGDQQGERLTLNNLGIAYAEVGAFRRALPYFQQALMSVQTSGYRRGEGGILTNLGRAYTELGEFQHAIAYLDQALAINREFGSRREESITLNEMGRTYVALGQTWRAIDTCECALKIVRALGDRYYEGWVLSVLGRAYAAADDLGRAAKAFEMALGILQALDDRSRAAECSWHFGLVMVRQGKRREALELLRVCVAYEQEIGHANAMGHAALLARLEAGEELLVKAWGEPAAPAMR